jgi:RNA polymerase sigma-70 factor (ECF subfamily)
MFNFLAFAGILLLQHVDIVPTEEARIRERVYPSMTLDKSANQPKAEPLADDAALIRLYEQFRRPIHSYIYRLLGSQEDADDVTQEVFVRVFVSWSSLYERDNLSSWIYRIATNLCVDALRKRKRISWWPLRLRSHQDDYSGDGELQEDYMSLLSDSGGIPEIAERELIRLALANMPEEYAVVLVLSAAQGVPYQEIAHILNISPNASATRISRAKKLFAKQYQHVCKDGVGKQE